MLQYSCTISINNKSTYDGLVHFKAFEFLKYFTPFHQMHKLQLHDNTCMTIVIICVKKFMHILTYTDRLNIYLKSVSKYNIITFTHNLQLFAFDFVASPRSSV